MAKEENLLKFKVFTLALKDFREQPCLLLFGMNKKQEKKQLESEEEIESQFQKLSKSLANSNFLDFQKMKKKKMEKCPTWVTKLQYILDF